MTMSEDVKTGCRAVPPNRGTPAQRAVIFIDRVYWAPAILVRAAMAALDARQDARLSAICLTRPQNFPRMLFRHGALRAILGIGSLLKTAVRIRHDLPVPIDLNRCARRNRFRILLPPAGDVNHPEFVNALREEVRPTIALSFYCPRKFGPDLLAVLGCAVNYHNGLLPDYRGLAATSWSVYEGKGETGFTFHRMNENIDEGPILFQGTVPVDPDSNIYDLELEKAIVAARLIPHLLDAIVRGDPGVPQEGAARYFSGRDVLAVTRISSPSLLSSVELARRLRAFGSLELRIAGKWHRVTRVREVRNGRGDTSPFRFRTCDGVLMEAAGFMQLPWAVYRPVKRIRDCLRRRG